MHTDEQVSRKQRVNTSDEEGSYSRSESSSYDNKKSNEIDHRPPKLSSNCVTEYKSKTAKEAKTMDPNNDTDVETTVLTTERGHILFIQMQLCSVQTLADFLANRRARGSTLSPSTSSSSLSYAVDIPFALRLFSQIANGVKYVHSQGLIHRDLKPQVRIQIVFD